MLYFLPCLTVVKILHVLCLIVQSYLTLCDPMDCSPPDSSVHGHSLGKNTRVGCHAFLQEKFAYLSYLRNICVFFFKSISQNNGNKNKNKWDLPKLSKGNNKQN